MEHVLAAALVDQEVLAPAQEAGAAEVLARYAIMIKFASQVMEKILRIAQIVFLAKYAITMESANLIAGKIQLIVRIVFLQRDAITMGSANLIV